MDSYLWLIVFADRELAFCYLGYLELGLDPLYLCKTLNREHLSCFEYSIQLSEKQI